MRSEGQSDTTGLTNAFHHFAKASKSRTPTWTTAAPETDFFFVLMFRIIHLPVRYHTERLCIRPPITNFEYRIASCKAKTLATTGDNFTNSHYVTELWSWRTFGSLAVQWQRHVQSSLELTVRTFVYYGGSQSFCTLQKTHPLSRDDSSVSIHKSQTSADKNLLHQIKINLVIGTAETSSNLCNIKDIKSVTSRNEVNMGVS